MKQDSCKKFNLATMLTMVLLAVVQFIPYWQYDGKSASVQGYIWFVSEDLTSYLENTVGAFDMNDVIIMPILVLLLAVAVIPCYIKWRDAPIASGLGIVCGIVGLWGYISCSIYHAGIFYGVHIALCAAILLLGLIGIGNYLFRAACPKAN